MPDALIVRDDHEQHRPLDDVPDELIHRLRAGLTEDRFEEEVGAGLAVLLDRIADFLVRP